MNTLIAILVVFLAAFVAEKVVLVLSRIFGLFAIVQERTCRVYVLFGKVIGILDEPGLHILPFKIGPAAFVINFLGTCHVLDLRPSFGTASPTLDAADLLLSKLQIVELNAKDAHDIFHLLSGVPIGRDTVRPGIDPGRFGSVLAGDWGWWRTVTGSLDKLPGLLAENPALAPPQPRFDPLAQAKQLREVADAVPKSLKWKLRSNIGAKVRWYELPEEVDH